MRISGLSLFCLLVIFLSFDVEQDSVGHVVLFERIHASVRWRTAARRPPRIWFWHVEHLLPAILSYTIISFRGRMYNLPPVISIVASYIP